MEKIKVILRGGPLDGEIRQILWSARTEDGNAELIHITQIGENGEPFTYKRMKKRLFVYDPPKENELHDANLGLYIDDDNNVVLELENEQMGMAHTVVLDWQTAMGIAKDMIQLAEDCARNKSENPSIDDE